MKSTPDFHRIPERQLPIHSRLENWSAWVHASRMTPSAPMWRFTHSNSRMWRQPEPRREVDPVDGLAIEQAVRVLPIHHRHAIRWSYVYRNIPVARAARRLGVTYDTLAQLVIDARAMLGALLEETHANAP